MTQAKKATAAQAKEETAAQVKPVTAVEDKNEAAPVAAAGFPRRAPAGVERRLTPVSIRSLPCPNQPNAPYAPASWNIPPVILSIL